MSTNAYFFHLSADFILSFYLWCVFGWFFLCVLGCFVAFLGKSMDRWPFFWWNWTLWQQRKLRIFNMIKWQGQESRHADIHSVLLILLTCSPSVWLLSFCADRVKTNISKLVFSASPLECPSKATRLSADCCIKIKLHVFLLRPKKNICVFTVTCQKNLGLVRINFFFFIITCKTGNSRSGIRFRYFFFEISGKMTNYAVFIPSLLSISTKS
jgi:hypothetical protein